MVTAIAVEHVQRWIFGSPCRYATMNGARSVKKLKGISWLVRPKTNLATRAATWPLWLAGIDAGISLTRRLRPSILAPAERLGQLYQATLDISSSEQKAAS